MICTQQSLGASQTWVQATAQIIRENGQLVTWAAERPL